MSATTLTRILVLGATGYIGGSVLTELLQHTDTYHLSALVRKHEQAQKLKDVGVDAFLFENLDDLEEIRRLAALSDVVVAAASARHEGAARACIEGLGMRRKETARQVHYIHTSGASMLGDWPVTKERVDPSVYSDIDDDIYTIEKNHPESYSPVRKVNQLVVRIGEQEGVQTYIVPPPLIFGVGTGLFRAGIGQVDMLVELALARSPPQSVVIDKGIGIWNRIHIEDLSYLFYILVDGATSRPIPNGREGYYFAENGFQTWRTIAESIAKALKTQNIADTNEIVEIGLKEAADIVCAGNERETESLLGSNARIKGDRARKILGFKPQYEGEAFERHVEHVVAIMSKK